LIQEQVTRAPQSGNGDASQFIGHVAGLMNDKGKRFIRGDIFVLVSVNTHHWSFRIREVVSNSTPLAIRAGWLSWVNEPQFHGGQDHLKFGKIAQAVWIGFQQPILEMFLEARLQHILMTERPNLVQCATFGFNEPRLNLVSATARSVPGSSQINTRFFGRVFFERTKIIA
jgi:hypothetical protein